MSDESDELDETPENLYRAYEGHAQILRTWLVAYGIGGPVLFLTNERLAQALARSGQAQGIAKAFLAGVALQVILATINKAAMWTTYYGKKNSKFRNTRSYRVAYWLSVRFWIDLSCDIATLVLFGWATLRVFTIVVGGEIGH